MTLNSVHNSGVSWDFRTEVNAHIEIALGWGKPRIPIAVQPQSAVRTLHARRTLTPITHLPLFWIYDRNSLGRVGRGIATR